MRHGIAASVMNNIAALFTTAAAPVSGVSVAAPEEDAGKSVFATLLAQLQGGAPANQGQSGSPTGNGSFVAPGQKVSAAIKGAHLAGMKANARGGAAQNGEAANNTLPSDLAGIALGNQPAQAADKIKAQFASEAAAQSALADVQVTGNKPAATDAGKQTAELKAADIPPATNTNDALHPAFAQLLANANAAAGRVKAPAVHAGTKHASGDTQTANTVSPTINAQHHALIADDKSAISQNGNSGSAGQQNSSGQHAHQAFTGVKPVDTSAAAQASATTQPQGFAAELVQVQSAANGAPLPGQVPLEALAVQIARKFDQGLSQFEISLHPAELGKLDISLNVSDDGRVNAVLRAERPETLDLLRQDSRQLETQLRQAGLDVGSNSLSFQLSHGNNQRQAQNNQEFGKAFGQQAQAQASEETKINYVAVRKRDGLDIHV